MLAFKLILTLNIMMALVFNFVISVLMLTLSFEELVFSLTMMILVLV